MASAREYFICQSKRGGDRRPAAQPMSNARIVSQPATNSNALHCAQSHQRCMHQGASRSRTYFSFTGCLGDANNECCSKRPPLTQSSGFCSLPKVIQQVSEIFRCVPCMWVGVTQKFLTTSQRPLVQSSRFWLPDP